MTYAQALDLDQARIEIQDTIALIYQTSGESDGYEGIYPQQRDYEYLSGYAMGVWRYRSETLPPQQEEPTPVPF